jgi:hypothetical protein
LYDADDPYIIKSDSEELILTFSSDDSVTERGFKIAVSAYDP